MNYVLEAKKKKNRHSRGKIPPTVLNSLFGLQLVFIYKNLRLSNFIPMTHVEFLSQCDPPTEEVHPDEVYLSHQAEPGLHYAPF